MTPKEKAHELVYETFRKAIAVSKYHLRHNPGHLEKSKRCAMTSVDEILKKHFDDWNSESEYWQEVKKEIEIL